MYACQTYIRLLYYPTLCAHKLNVVLDDYTASAQKHAHKFLYDAAFRPPVLYCLFSLCCEYDTYLKHVDII